MEDKRQNIRWQMERAASINLVKQNQALLDCKISDISLRGARISVREKLPQADKLILAINNPDGMDNFEAAIIWWHEAENLYNYGLCFNNIGENGKNRICNLVYNNLPDEVKKPLWERDASGITH